MFMFLTSPSLHAPLPTTTLRAQVTWEDIRRGNRKSADSCAIALAILREARGVGQVGVSGGHVALWKPGCDGEQFQHNGGGFIWRFDRLPHIWPFVQPFTLELTKV